MWLDILMVTVVIDTSWWWCLKVGLLTYTVNTAEFPGSGWNLQYVCVCLSCVDWMNLGWDRDWWRALVMKLWVWDSGLLRCDTVAGLVVPDILIVTQCLQTSRFEGCENSLTPCPLKCIEPLTQWHSFTSQNTWIINSAAVAIWSLTQILVSIKFWGFSFELRNWFRFSSWILLYGVS